MSIHPRLPWSRRSATFVAAAAALSGATVALAAGAGGHELDVGAELHKVLVHAVNLALFVGIVVYFARRPVKDFLANRSLAVAHELDEAHRLKSEAQQSSRSVEERLTTLDQQVGEMMDGVRRECEVEARRTAERAAEAAQQIEDAARRTVVEETEKARHDLRQETAELAVETAAELLARSVSDDDHRRIAASYMDRMAEES